MRNPTERPYTKQDILTILHPLHPTATEELGNKLGLPDTVRVVTVADARVELISLLWDMTQAGLIDFIEGQGYIKT
jgi:hypothetical protein